jgi:hypothetical protein
VGNLMSALVLSLTVVMAVAVGIFTAYGTVLFILHGLVFQSTRQTGPTVLIPSQTHASGD